MRRLLLLPLLLAACGGGSQPSCSPASCSGCCTTDGRCVVEVRERDTYCGFDGAACVDCLTQGKTCSTTALSCQ